MMARLDKAGDLNAAIELSRIDLTPQVSVASHVPSDIEQLSFSRNAPRLLAGFFSALYILDPVMRVVLQIVQIGSQVRSCAFLSLDDAASTRQEGTLSNDEETADEARDVIQRVEHDDEPAALIPPSEAAHMQAVLWASSVESLVRCAGDRPATTRSLLLLTFARQTRLLEAALLASPPAQAAARFTDLQPSW